MLLVYVFFLGKPCLDPFYFSQNVECILFQLQPNEKLDKLAFEEPRFTRV
jgi:hypothetical protein